MCLLDAPFARAPGESHVGLASNIDRLHAGAHNGSARHCYIRRVEDNVNDILVPVGAGETASCSCSTSSGS